MSQYTFTGGPSSEIESLPSLPGNTEYTPLLAVPPNAARVSAHDAGLPKMVGCMEGTAVGEGVLVGDCEGFWVGASVGLIELLGACVGCGEGAGAG